MRAEPPLIAANRLLLLQGLELLDRLDDDLYATPPGEGVSPVGSHVRHCLDVYVCFLDGLGGGRIDYDARERDTLIEQDRRYALRLIESIIDRLGDLPGEVEDEPLEVSVDRVDRDEAHWWSRSTGRRELQFLRSHTVHHYALIALLLRQGGTDPGPEFGVAPSTLAYERRRTADRNG